MSYLVILRSVNLATDSVRKICIFLKKYYYFQVFTVPENILHLIK